tara:strand:+ start:427 stop:624 length:198 start_codon:yes stop_codon:yes gene_type:complete
MYTTTTEHKMNTVTLNIGTKLQNEFGTWIVTNITHFDGDMWYDIRGEHGEIVLYPSQIKYYTIID